MKSSPPLSLFPIRRVELAQCRRDPRSRLCLGVALLAAALAAAFVFRHATRDWEMWEPPIPTASELHARRARLVAATRVSGGDEEPPVFAVAGAETSWRARLAALRVLGVPSYWDADKHAALISSLLVRAKDNTLVVMYGTGAMEDFLLNAVCHWSRLRIDNYVVFSSGTALSALRAHPALHGAPTAAAVDIIDVLGPVIGGVDLQAYHGFDSAEGFSTQTRVKFLLAELMVQLGLHVIVQDADAIALRDFRPHILGLACSAVQGARAHSPSGDAAVSKSTAAATCGTADFSQAAAAGELFALDSAPFIYISLEFADEAHFPDRADCNCNHNTGFFFLRSSYFSVFAMRHLVRVLERNTEHNDQRVFGEFIRSWGPLTADRIATLSYDLFPSGVHWRGEPTSKENGALVIHANWMVGLARKKRKITRAGMMLWDVEERRCYAD